MRVSGAIRKPVFFLYSIRIRRVLHLYVQKVDAVAHAACVAGALG
jgi:hypothetical protein